MELADFFRLAGIGQLGILVASSLVPFKLNFIRDLAVLNTLHRQLYWTYGGYVVMGIVMLGVTSFACAEELASGSRLAKCFCGYGAAFWGIRLALQAVFDVKPHLTEWWMPIGYHVLTVAFAAFAVLYVFALVR